MADVTSRLRLVVSSSGLDKADRRLKRTKRSAKDLGDAAARLKAVFGSLAVVGGGIFGGSVLRETADFSKQISAVGVIAGATADQFSAFEVKSRELGKTTAFSAKEAAEGMQFLAMAGFSANDVLKTIGPSLDLAAAGALELGTAADIASNILTSFQLEAEELPRIADVLAQSASSSNTSVEQLGQGFKFVGSVASNLNISLEQVAAGMSVLGNAGLQAEMAGTGLRRVLIGLADPSENLLKKMGGLRIESDGLVAVMRQIASAGLTTTEAIKDFGQRGGPAILNLIAGFEDLEEFTGKNLEAYGRAAEIAAGRLDNLSGDVVKLTSAYSEFLLSVGDGKTNDAARRFVQSFKDQINSDDFAELADLISGAMADGLNAATVAINVLLPLLDDVARLLQAMTAGAVAFGVAISVAAGIRFAQNIAAMIALERALGATNKALALQSVLAKGAQRAWIGLTAAIAANPIGAIALAIAGAITAIVFFSDEIAKVTFGVQNFGVVMQATFQVLGPIVSGVFDQLAAGMAKVIDYFKTLGMAALNSFDRVRKSVSAIIPPEAFDAVKNFGNFIIDVYVAASKTVAELYTDALLLPVRALNKLYSAIGNIDILPDGVQQQMRQASKEFENFIDAIDERVGRENIGSAAKSVINGVKSVAGGVVDVYGDIRNRAHEIAIETEAQAAAIENISDGMQQARDISSQLNSNISLVTASDLSDGFKDKLVSSASDAFKEIQNALDAADLAKSSGDLDQAAAAMQALDAATASGFAEVKKLKKALEGVTKNTDKAAASADKLAGIYKDIENQQTLIEAARLGERQQKVAREFLNIRRQIKDITVDEAKALAEQNVLLDEQLERIQDQRAIIEAPFESLASNLENAILNGGRDGVDGLKNVFKSFVQDLKSSFIRQIFDPLFQSIRSFGGISLGGPNGVISGSLLSGASPAGGIFTPGVNGAAGGFGGLKQFLNPGFLLGAGALSLGGGGASQLFGLASLLGPGRLGSGVAQIGNLFGLPGGITDIFGEAFSNAGTFGGALGGIGGSLLSGSLFGRSNSQQIGSAVGGVAGNLIPVPVLGPLIGSFLGGAIGSLFGGKASDKVGQVSFNPLTGAEVGFGSKDQSDQSLENLSAARNISDNIFKAVSAIAEFTGGTLRNIPGGAINEDLLNVAVGSRDGVRIGFQGTSGQAQTFNFENSEEGAAKAIERGIQLALSQLKGGDDRLTNVARSLAEVSTPVEDIASVLETLKNVAEIGKPPVSQYQQALNDLNAAIDEATQAANGSAEAEAALAAARKDGIDLIREAFEKSIGRRLLEQTDPLRAAFDDLSDSIKTILDDAEALGVATGEGSNVSQVIANDLNAFFEQALQNGTSVADLTSRLDEFKKALTDLGVTADIARAALGRAVETQREAFDKQVQTDLGGFLDGPLDRLNALLAAQAERLEAAEAIGANLNEVARLTQLEQVQFFEGLNDQALAEVSDFLGLFKEASNSVAQNLDLSRQDLRGRSDRFGQFAQNFASLDTQFAEQFVSASGRESLSILRGRANELLGQINNGNESAAQALPQVLQQLVRNARDTFGNTQGFTDILQFARDALSEAEQSAIDVQSEAERQIEALDAQTDILSDIRDVLKSQEAFNALFASAANGGIASSQQLLDLIRSGAGLTPVSNKDISTISITGLIAQSLALIIQPFTDSLGVFTSAIEPLPALQQLTIDAIDRSADRIVEATEGISERLDRIERIAVRQLTELENAA